MGHTTVKKLLLLSILFLLNGCALNRLFLFDEIDKVNVVKYTPHVKVHRAYFTRTDLKPIIKGKRYLFLYHPRRKALVVLLRKPNRFLLYTLTTPHKAARPLYTKSVRQTLRKLYKEGYKSVKSLQQLGFSVKVGKRRYKRVKTIMIELHDYRALKALYRRAIKHYRYATVASVDEHLPKPMIEGYLKSVYAKAKNPAQRSELAKIARKLGIALHGATHTPAPTHTTHPTSLQPEEPQESDPIEPLYPYYLRQASLTELDHYLKSSKSYSELTNGERQMLTHRLTQLKQEKMLKDAPLEDLIAAYKENKDPRFKARILERIKELQGH